MAYGLAIGSSGVVPAEAQLVLSNIESASAWGFKSEFVDKSSRSGDPISFYTSEDIRFSVSLTQEVPMSAEEKMRQYRYKAIERTFLKNSDGLPGNKMNYLIFMANVMCGISFFDNISSFNKYDETIDSIFRMDGGLTLTMTQFLDEDIDAPVVFSIHRGEVLLVSAEMKLDELAKTVNEVLISEVRANV